jgi:predicted alpha/beta-fold hydrolase
MPILKNNTFKPNLVLKNQHFNTVFRYYFNKENTKYKRQRIELKDGDFIDLDFASVQSKTAIIATHGLEGSSSSNYIQALARTANQKNIDLIAFNLRSCSGEPNRTLASYHSGKTEDLVEVIDFVIQNYNYEAIHLVGYSLGGNLSLKYMGEYADIMPDIIQSAVGVSVPCNLEGSALTLNSSFFRRKYLANFLKTLKSKALEKLEKFPNNMNVERIVAAKDFIDFDDAFTAPSHGFKDAKDYWAKCSSKPFLPQIKRKSLLISSLDDPFLDASCFPFDEAENNKYFYFLATKHGGHVGFSETFNINQNTWLEEQILAFLT